MELADREWRLIREERRSGTMNMALDEVAAETAANDGPRTLRVYRWTPSTLSLGYHQPAETVDWAHCEDHDVAVVRRPTGGGGIYHDAFGDISYSIVAPADDLPSDLTAAYELLLEPVLEAFERMGVRARIAETAEPALHEPMCYLREIDPAHDVVVAGRKISGNAQYRQREAVIQHGSLTFAKRAETHLRCFTRPGLEPRQFDDRVTAVREHADIDRPAAVGALETTFADWVDAEDGTWTDPELERGASIAAEKYATADWTRRR